MSDGNSQTRRALVLVGKHGPTYEADVVIDGPWAHLTNVRERVFRDLYQERSDRILSAAAIREIRLMA